MVKGNSGLLSLVESFKLPGGEGINQLEQTLVASLQNSPSKYGIKLDPQYLAEEQMRLQMEAAEPDQKGAQAVDVSRIKLLNASSEGGSNDGDARRSMKSASSHDNTDDEQTPV